MPVESMELHTAQNVEEIDKKIWNQLAFGKGEFSSEFEYNPFLNWEFYHALENSGSATQEEGWLPLHLVVKEKKEIKGIMPCYLKSHSMGEYVFDYAWANALEQAGQHYYPKLQCAVPFTPVNGRRFLVGKDKNEKIINLLANGAKAVCEKLNASSVHITFMEKQQWELAEKCGYMTRLDQQYHWKNNGYQSFDAFLDSLNSRKRKTIKKERKEALKNGEIKIEWIGGKQMTKEIWKRFFQFYQDTSGRKWGRPYLTFEFFQQIGETMADDIVMIMAKRKGEYIAGAINFVGSHTLFGRHWGCIEDHRFLHFEICYYQAIEYAIKNKLKTVEAGAQGEHKLARGYEAQITRSAHFIAHQGLKNAVEQYLKYEKKEMKKYNEIIKQNSPYKRKETK